MGKHNVIIYNHLKGANGVMECPNCKRKDLGKIGSQQYYCWNCFIEIAVVNEEVEIHQIESDGSLSSLNDLFTDEERRFQW